MPGASWRGKPGARSSAGTERDRLGQQQPVFGRDIPRNLLGKDPVAPFPQAGRAQHIHGQGPVQPPLQPGQVGPGQIVAAGEHRHPRPAATARSSTRSVSPPQAWAETTRSSRPNATSARPASSNRTRPRRRGQSPSRAAASAVALGGTRRSTARATGELSSSSSMIQASRPWPQARSTTRPPRKRRRTRRATSHASYSSLRGRQPARQTARAMPSNRVSPLNRGICLSASLLRDDRSIISASPCVFFPKATATVVSRPSPLCPDNYRIRLCKNRGANS